MKSSDNEPKMMESNSKVEMLNQLAIRVEELKAKEKFLRTTLQNDIESLSLEEYRAIEAEINATQKEVNVKLNISLKISSELDESL